eukprot:bmy_16338T0
MKLWVGEPGCMTVTWTTWVPTPSEVQFGLQLWGPLPRAQGTFSPFVDGGILRRKLYIHRVTLQGLLPGVQYVYRCGSTQSWSRRFLFGALKNGPHWSACLAVFGDTGTDNPRALLRLCRGTQQGKYDAVLHVGEASARVRLEGCEEWLTPLTLFPRPWSAVRIKEYGYTQLHNLNGTHVHIQQVSDDQK